MVRNLLPPPGLTSNTGGPMATGAAESCRPSPGYILRGQGTNKDDEKFPNKKSMTSSCRISVCPAFLPLVWFLPDRYFGEQWRDFSVVVCHFDPEPIEPIFLWFLEPKIWLGGCARFSLLFSMCAAIGVFFAFNGYVFFPIFICLRKHFSREPTTENAVCVFLFFKFLFIFRSNVISTV